MGNTSSKPATDPSHSASTPSSPSFDAAHLAVASAALAVHTPAPARSSFSVESLRKSERRHLQHRRSHSYNPRPIAPRSQHSDSGISSGKSQHEVALASDSSDNTTPQERIVDLVDSKTPRADDAEAMTATSSMSDKSISSNGSGIGSSSGGSDSLNSAGRRCNSATEPWTTPATLTAGGASDSHGQLGLQRFPTGESEYKRPLSRSKTGEQSRKSHEITHTRTSRTTSTVSSSSARSSGSFGFKFPKFKPLLYSHGNDSKNQQHLYQHHNNSSAASTALNSQHHLHHLHHHSHPHSHPHSQHSTDPFANSPFPTILLSIKLPQSLLDKYVIDQESFRHGKAIWGIGLYSWTITVISRSNGKKYVIKRVSKAALPPSAYYHYPTTAHKLCTCPACKSSREQLLQTGQLDQKELEGMQEVLIIENQGNRKEHHHPLSPRPLSPTATLSSATPRDVKDKRKSLNLYNGNNSSMPNQQGKFWSFSSNSSPQTTPVNSRPSTPSLSPLRLFSSPPGSSSGPSLKGHGHGLKIHSRSHSASIQHAMSPSPLQSPLLPSTSSFPWLHKESDSRVSHGVSDLFSRDSESTRPSEISSGNGARTIHRSTAAAVENHKRKTRLRRYASTPNLSRTVTGLDVLEEDPVRLEQLKQLSQNKPSAQHDQDSQLFAAPLSKISTMPALNALAIGGHQQPAGLDAEDGLLSAVPSVTFTDMERKVSPFDLQESEVNQVETSASSSVKTSEPRKFVPPPHALPMELVLLQTYNDSDHLPEHHEWTQDQDYWYYVTKPHGVKRRKLKKVSSWWLDMGSLGNVMLSGSSSHEPIATGPIYDMGHGTGNTTPMMPSSPRSSQLMLPNALSTTSGRSTPKELASLGVGLEPATVTSYAPSMSSVRRQSSPRNSHMGKYFYVDWDEYTSL
ncbi:hypothetical protein BGZ99_004159 [Dissophora globulifera]|uniref:Uncharacterized protein n=1 Tax=Dissophora globulifera TaxID=979702 RepID=A0A9P6RJD1_9FUNG|nr:hypothetical protein BGZ99_004159 [Dissophora globulifera]